MFTVKQAKQFCTDNNLTNIEIRSLNSVRARLMFDGVSYQFALEGTELTKVGLLLAASKVEELRKLQKYNPAKFRSLALSNTIDDLEDVRRLSFYIDEFLTAKSMKVAKSTIKGYTNKIKRYIKPHFADHKVTDITALDIERFVNRKLTDLSNKTIKEVLMLFNQLFVLALLDGEIEQNPMEFLRSSNLLNLKSAKVDPDPFSMDEITKIAETPTYYKNEVNMFCFNCFVGLRMSELMALCWDDIDLDNDVLYVRRAVVNGSYKRPKTESSYREVKILPKAKKILLLQYPKTGEKGKQTIQVTLEDNRTVRNERVRFIFPKTLSGKPYRYDGHYRQRFFQEHLKDAGVRYRGPNQSRHTYASHLISHGLPLTWIAMQMGHTTVKMLEKHYGKWMPKKGIDISQIAARAFYTPEK